jgi:hypothetical protein
VPTFNYPLLVPVKQTLRQKNEADEFPYEIADVQIFALASAVGNKRCSGGRGLHQSLLSVDHGAERCRRFVKSKISCDSRTRLWTSTDFRSAEPGSITIFPPWRTIDPAGSRLPRFAADDEKELGKLWAGGGSR